MERLTRHWRLLTASTAAIMAVLMAAPAVLPEPQIQENRVLASWPRPLQGLSDLPRYRTEMDAWVADHFPPRTFLIAGLNRLRMLAGASGSPKVAVGRQGWLFYDDSSHLGPARADPAMSPEEVRVWALHLAGRTEAMAAEGRAYVVLSPPMKETIYGDFGPPWYPGPSRERNAVVLARAVAASGAGAYIYPHDEMVAARRAGAAVYSRHDTHWTGAGAYVGYAALMGRLHAMGEAEAPRPRSDFVVQHPTGRHLPRDLAMMLGVASLVRVEAPNLVDPPAGDRGRTTWPDGGEPDWTKLHVIETGQAGKPVMLMLGDSFSNALMPMLMGHFSRIVFAHNQDGGWRPDLVARFQPDIVVTEVIEGGLPFAMRDAPPPAPATAQRIEAAVSKAMAEQIAARSPQMAPTAPEAVAALDAAKAVPACFVDYARVSRTGEPGGRAGRFTLELGGWITDFGESSPQGRGLARLTGPGLDISAEIAVDKPRPDVADYFKKPAAQASGFSGLFAGRAPTGVYQLRIYRRGAGGWLVCQAPAPVTLP